MAGSSASKSGIMYKATLQLLGQEVGDDLSLHTGGSKRSCREPCGRWQNCGCCRTSTMELQTTSHRSLVKSLRRWNILRLSCNKVEWSSGDNEPMRCLRKLEVQLVAGGGATCQAQLCMTVRCHVAKHFCSFLGLSLLFLKHLHF